MRHQRPTLAYQELVSGVLYKCEGRSLGIEDQPKTGKNKTKHNKMSQFLEEAQVVLDLRNKEPGPDRLVWVSAAWHNHKCNGTSVLVH